MPPRTGTADVAKGELAGILRGYGINPKLFDDLIREAIVNQWTPQEFISQVYASDEFSAAFPGIFNKDGSLKLSPGQYLQLAYGDNGYVEIGKNYGLKLGINKIGELVQGNISPTEWAFRASILQQAKSSEAYRHIFNQELTAAGQDKLGKKEWFDFLASKSNARIENLYEAVSLRNDTGLELTAQQALGAAKAIGAETPGAKVDITKIVQQAQQYKDVIGPDLQAAGITDADLAVLASGADPKGIATQLDQILRNRQALTQSGGGGSAGRVGKQFATQREGL